MDSVSATRCVRNDRLFEVQRLTRCDRGREYCLSVNAFRCTERTSLERLPSLEMEHSWQRRRVGVSSETAHKAGVTSKDTGKHVTSEGDELVLMTEERENEVTEIAVEFG